MSFPTGKYDVILADPPWRYRVYDKSDAAHGAARSHYETMTLQEIISLPVKHIAAKNCALFLWVTPPCLPEGLEVIKAWGFEFVTIAFTWVKVNKNGTWWLGLGHWTRGNPEICLLARRGRIRRVAKDVPQLIVAQRREHSRKPDEQYERIERLLKPKKAIELFARHRWPGWDAWGDEVDG